MIKTYNFVEVPLVGYTLTENPRTFGYRELFKKDYNVEVYLSEESKLKTLETIVDTEAKKGKVKTLVYGVGTAGTAATASSAVASVSGLVCSGGVCPLWIGPMFFTIVPFAWMPFVVIGGPVIAKRLGGRKGLQNISSSFPEKARILDYALISNLIKHKDMETKITEYSLSKISGTRKEKLGRMIKGDPKLKLLRQELKEGFESLVDESYKMFIGSKEEEKELYKAINKTYNYMAKRFGGKILKTKDYLIFGT